MDISGVLIWYDLLVARTGDWSNVRIWISMKGKWEDWPLAVKYLFYDWYCPDQTIQYLIFPILTLPHRACGVVRPGHWRTFLTWPACCFSHSGLHRQEQSCQTSPTAALPAVSTNLYTARAALDSRRVSWICHTMVLEESDLQALCDAMLHYYIYHKKEFQLFHKITFVVVLT